VVTTPIDFPQDVIESFCRKWKIREFAVFGSILRDDFRPDSDIDVLVTIDPAAEWGLFALAAMQRELSDALHRNVDLNTRDAVEESANPRRRREILDSARTLYAA
jgi:predicted nucleotidyltransferase